MATDEATANTFFLLSFILHCSLIGHTLGNELGLSLVCDTVLLNQVAKGLTSAERLYSFSPQEPMKKNAADAGVTILVATSRSLNFALR